eukprot:2872072-Pleurochrysis_carterae.AAC.1
MLLDLRRWQALVPNYHALAPSPVLVAASGRDDDVRAPNEQIVRDAHGYTVARKAESPFDQEGAMRFGLSNSAINSRAQSFS